MQEWYDANQWFSAYMIFTSMIAFMVMVSSLNGNGLLGFYKKDASLFGKFVIILFLIALLPAMIYISFIVVITFLFFKAMTKGKE